MKYCPIPRNVNSMTEAVNKLSKKVVAVVVVDLARLWTSLTCSLVEGAECTEKGEVDIILHYGHTVSEYMAVISIV